MRSMEPAANGKCSNQSEETGSLVCCWLKLAGRWFLPKWQKLVLIDLILVKLWTWKKVRVAKDSNEVFDEENRRVRSRRSDLFTFPVLHRNASSLTCRKHRVKDIEPTSRSLSGRPESEVVDRELCAVDHRVSRDEIEHTRGGWNT